jgi:hypothetical protein
MADQVRWFEFLGTCPCGKAATGTLRGPRNEREKEAKALEIYLTRNVTIGQKHG